MSPEEQVDKYLKSVEKEARFRQKLRQRAEALEGHTDYRTTFDPSRHLTQDVKRVNTAISSRWHSLDSVTRPVLAKGVKNNITHRNNRKIQSPTDHGKKPLTRLGKISNKRPNFVDKVGEAEVIKISMFPARVDTDIFITIRFQRAIACPNPYMLLLLLKLFLKILFVIFFFYVHKQNVKSLTYRIRNPKIQTL